MIDITMLRNWSRLRKYDRGTVISDSRNGVVMFAVLKGEALIIAGHGTPKVEQVARLGAGAFYIDAALAGDTGAAYTAFAVNDTVVLPIDRSVLYDFMREEPEIAGEIVRELANRRDSAQQADGLERDAIIQAGQSEGHQAVRHNLFPEGHGACRLPLDLQDDTCLMNKKVVCPLCAISFTTQTIRPSKLVMERTESDMRIRYKGIEPLYYDVITCPNCFYSALQDVFDKPERRRQDIRREISDLLVDMDHVYSALTDSDSVFARYYLALRCAPVGFIRHQYLSAKLLYILSRLYQDAGNKEMEDEIAVRALEAFLAAFQNERLTSKQEEQVCVLIGELYFKQNDMRNSVTFFRKAREVGEKTSVLRRHAENRIYDIRDTAGVR